MKMLSSVSSKRFSQPSKDNAFLGQLRQWTRKIACFGALNSLAQTLLKLTCPGAPDLYQGTELWDLHFVDPDNRQAVDFEQRRKFLAEIKKREKESLQPLLLDLLAHWEDGRVKLFLIYKALNFRRRQKALFQNGSYVPLAVSGMAASRVCAFARRDGAVWSVVAVPRLSTAIFSTENAPLGRQGSWEDTALELPGDSPATWRDVFTGETLPEGKTADGKRYLYLRDLFRDFPVALLERQFDGVEGHAGFLAARRAFAVSRGRRERVADGIWGSFLPTLSHSRLVNTEPHLPNNRGLRACGKIRTTAFLPAIKTRLVILTLWRRT